HRVPRHGPRRHAPGGRVLPPRRHPPVRAAAAAGQGARPGVTRQRRPATRSVGANGEAGATALVEGGSHRPLALGPAPRLRRRSPVGGRDQPGEGVPEIGVGPAVARPRPGGLPVLAPLAAVVNAAAGVVAAVPGLVLPREPTVQLLVLAAELVVPAPVVVVAVPLGVLPLEAADQLVVLAARPVVLLAPPLVVAVGPADGSAGMAPPAARAMVVVVPTAIIPASPVPPTPIPALPRHVPSDHHRRVSAAPAVIVVRQAGAAAGDLRLGRGGAAQQQRARENEQHGTHELPPGGGTRGRHGGIRRAGIRTGGRNSFLIRGCADLRVGAPAAAWPL